MGFGLGGLFGVFTASIDWGNSSTLALRDEPFKVQVKHALKDTRTRAWQMGKSFGSIGLVYAGVECVVEGVMRCFFTRPLSKKSLLIKYS